MICPKCKRADFVEFAQGDTHSICVKNPNTEEETGCGAQFVFTIDKKIKFPHNVIFGNRRQDEFFRKPLLQLPSKT